MKDRVHTGSEPLILTQKATSVVTPVYDAAVVLAGCGHRDGTEITEAATLLVALSERGFRTRVYAPLRPQSEVINHRSGAREAGTPRSILDESARIARGKIAPLSDLRASGFDALFFAGGFGVALNLCDFASAGAGARLFPDVADVLGAFYDGNKVIGALCIAPVLLGLLARDRGLAGMSLTLGDGKAAEAVAALSAWGVRHQPCQVRQACVDTVHRVVSAPAYMDGAATPGDIMASSLALVEGAREILSRRAAVPHGR